MLPKISSILPSNSRITSVDMASEPGRRSGAPSFGVQNNDNRSVEPTRMGLSALDRVNILAGKDGNIPTLTRQTHKTYGPSLNMGPQVSQPETNGPIINEVINPSPDLRSTGDEVLMSAVKSSGPN